LETELQEIHDFLSASPDFAVLPAPALLQLPRMITVRYLRRGSLFPPSEATVGELWLVRSGAVDLRNHDEELLDKLGEGDLFATVSPGDREELISGRVVEDALFYQIAATNAVSLCSQHNEFQERCRRAGRRSLQKMGGNTTNSARTDSVLRVSVGELVTRAPVTITPDASIQEAAVHMSEQSVSALLVMSGSILEGIVTDNDLRKRCLAAGLSRKEPVSRIMTRNLQTVQPETPALEALLMMSRRDIHHLPVVSGAHTVGLISTTDLIRHQGTNAVYLVRDIRRCEDLPALKRVAKALPELQIHLVQSGATAFHLGQAITAVIDALTRQLLRLAEAEIGAAPVPYAWLACGSQGRREQTVHTDQDNAILYAPSADPAVPGYFRELARLVTDGLNGCGIPHCPGDVSAIHPAWCRDAASWREAIGRVIDHPDRQQAMLATHYFDLRVIFGEEGLFAPIRQDALTAIGRQRLTLDQIAANALRRSPPLGFFRQLVLTQAGDQADTLDVKKQGLLLISGMAQFFALRSGVTAMHTLDRLKGAVDAGVLSTDAGANLADAYETLALLRARHQAEQIKQGLSPDNFVLPKNLSALERSHLKDAFGVIASMQKHLRNRISVRSGL
jgi:CBS domain-containing protein